ncbi:beta-galactosidase, partial [bacterium]
GWWYEGGGLYRHVWLNIANPTSIESDSVFARTELTGPEEAPTEATVVAGASFTRGDRTGPFRLVHRVIAPDGSPAGWGSYNAPASPRKSPSRASNPGGQDVFPDIPDNHWAWTDVSQQRIRISKPKLWSVEHPNLYRLETSLYQNAKLVDRVNTTFGIRSVRWDKDGGFFLNGKRTMLKGTCNHQDHAGVGVAIPDRLFEWRIKRLKEMGSNAYRCSHNPPATELLDACDRLGMLVLDETRHLGDATTAKSPPGTPYGELSELTRMVLRDRNHPSVFAWSLFNEEPLQGTDEGARIFQAMEKRVKELDPTREVTGAMNFGFNAGIQKVSKVFGFNYSLWAYDDVRKKDPHLALFGSETASAVSTRGIYANDKEKGYVSAYDVNHPEWGATAEKAWKEIANRPHMAGAFVWTGFDYKGEPTPYG